MGMDQKHMMKYALYVVVVALLIYAGYKLYKHYYPPKSPFVGAPQYKVSSTAQWQSHTEESGDHQ